MKREGQNVSAHENNIAASFLITITKTMTAVYLKPCVKSSTRIFTEKMTSVNDDSQDGIAKHCQMLQFVCYRPQTL